MPDAPTVVFTPPSSTPPSAPGAVFTPPTGSPPGAPGVVFTPPEDTPPSAPGVVFTPPEGTPPSAPPEVATAPSAPTEAGLVVTGSLTLDGSTPVTVPLLPEIGVFDGYPRYRFPTVVAPFEAFWEVVRGGDSIWRLERWNSSLSRAGQWVSSAGAATPMGATWTSSAQAPATGVPAFALVGLGLPPAIFNP